MQAAFRPAPAPLVPSTPHEAEVRLAELSASVEWTRKLMAGDMETRREFDRLTRLKADVTATDPLVEQLGETTLAPALGRREQLSAASYLRGEGASDSEIQFILSDQKYPEADVYAAQYWLPRLQRDPNLQVPDIHPADREGFIKFLGRIISIGTGP
jgi:hypothetical protein